MTRKYTLLSGKDYYFPKVNEWRAVAEANQDDRRLVRDQITYALYRPSDRIEVGVEAELLG